MALANPASAVVLATLALSNEAWARTLAEFARIKAAFAKFLDVISIVAENPPAVTPSWTVKTLFVVSKIISPFAPIVLASVTAPNLLNWIILDILRS